MREFKGSRRSLLLGGLPLAAMAASPALLAKPQPPAGMAGVVNAADYPNLQAAANAAFGTLASPNGTANVGNNKVLFIPNGVYLPPFSGAPVLDLRYLHGGRIIGAGRFVTKLRQNVAGVPVIRTNGCGYSHFEGMMLEHQVGVPGTCFDLSWDGTAGGPALQSNTFTDMEFYGGNFGIKIGDGGFMGSENLFQNCFWLLNSMAGLWNANYNALQQTIIGGNLQGCGIGVWAGVGSVPVIHGVGFQQQAVCDIKTEGNPSNNMHVSGCRTESPFFIDNAGGHGLEVTACTQVLPVPESVFVRQVGGLCKISTSRAAGKVIPQYWAMMKIEESGFDREDWLQPYQPWTIPNNGFAGCTEVENVWFGSSGVIRKRRYESSNTVDFNLISNYVTQLI